jgi:hypothetical protein
MSFLRPFRTGIVVRCTYQCRCSSNLCGLVGLQNLFNINEGIKMRQLIALLATVLLASTADAAPLMYEGFAYNTGQLPGNVNPSNGNPWNQPSTPTPTPAQSLIASGSLSYVGLASSTGNAFTLPRTANGNTTRINLTTTPFPGTQNADIFFSFLMRVDDILPTTDAIAGNANHQLGEFFAGLTNATVGAMSSGNVYAGMVRIRREVETVEGQTVQTGKYQLGLHKNNSNSVGTGNSFIQWDTSDSLSKGAIVMVVGEYVLNPAGVSDDTVRLWVNPIPGAVAGTPALEVTGGTDVSTTTPSLAQGAVGALWFRDGAGAITSTGGIRLGPMTIDEVRVGLSYADVTPGSYTSLAGDYNNDGIVDSGDYATWQAALANGGWIANETASPGTVDSADYDIWRGNFGAAAPGLGSSVSVPEPAGVILMLLGVFVTLLRIRRNS